ncbi:MAG: antibiotic biosynthesis monooxygenase [Mycobacterium sp.]
MTLVVTMDVDPALIDEKIEHVCKLAHEHSKRPGFVSCSIHKSTDNSRIVEYIQWESEEALAAMRKTFRAEGPQPPGFALKIDASFLDVVETFEPAEKS